MSECAPQLHSRGKQKVKKKKKKIKVRSLLFPITQASAALHSYLADRLPASPTRHPRTEVGSLGEGHRLPCSVFSRGLEGSERVQ